MGTDPCDWDVITQFFVDIAFTRSMLGPGGALMGFVDSVAARAEAAGGLLFCSAFCPELSGAVHSLAAACLSTICLAFMSKAARLCLYSAACAQGPQQL